jgi:HAE1 family hydrophobic/amphiphilic exporter-1
MAARRPISVSVLAAAVVVLGWTAWRGLPLDLLPDLQSPTVVVLVRSGDRPPAEMERLYGELLEQRLFAVSGIREIRQVARTGRIVGTVEFEWDADMDFALVEVEKAVGPLRSDPDIDEVVVRRFDPRQVPVVVVGLVAEPDGPDLAELREVARRQLATALERLQGVAEVRVTGGRERELRVEVDRHRLDAYGLTIAELERRLQEANIDINAGTLEEGSRVFIVRGLSRFRTPEDVAAVVVRYTQDASERSIPVRIDDVADVRWADGEIRHLVRVDGQEGVGLSIYKEAGANTVAVARIVREAVDDLAGDLPRMRLRLVSDESALVVDSMREVREAAIVGVLLSTLVLGLFLRALGPTVIVSLVVPVTMLATLFLMHFGGHSLNVMTLGGLALGIGMLLDNSIVIVESIFRRLSAGESQHEATVHGTVEVFGAIVGSTLTSCAVFLPIVFVQGLAARLVSGLSFTVVVSQIVSLVAAILLIPALAAWLLPRTHARAVDPGSRRVERWVALSLRQPVLVVTLGVLASLGGLWALVGLGTELLPPSDPQQFSVRLVGPPGQRVEATERVVAAVESVLGQAAGEDLVTVLSEVGRLPEDDRLIQEEQTEENTARVLVRLAPGGRSGKRIVAAAAPSIAALHGVSAEWEVGTTALARALGTTGPPIAVEVSGQSLDDLRDATGILAERMAGEPELWNVRSSFEGGPPELRVRLERGLADGLGVDLDAVAGALEASLDGRAVTVMNLGDEERDVVLALPRVRRDALLSVPLTTAGGQRIAIGDVATVEEAAGAREIFRRDQRRVARVTARVAEGSDFPKAQAAVGRVLAAAELPPGLRASAAGEEEERERTFRELRWAAWMALLLVFMVLAATFESLIHPLTVVAAVPLALVGVAGVLVPSGRPIGVMAMLGAIVLAGIAVNDAILLIDAARRLMAEGMARGEALARAAAIRLRPILMTTATTTLAVVPLALGTDETSELRSPMARTIIGGMITSMLGSLFVIPSLYVVLDRLRPRPWRRP